MKAGASRARPALRDGARRRLRAVVLALALTGAPPAPLPAGAADKALPVWKTGSEPLQVDSRTLETLGNEGVVIFQGDVVVRQGDVTLHADKVEVKVDRSTREIRAVRASGNVRISKAEVVASGDQADYDAKAGVAVLTGNPKVWRDRDVVAGDRITLYLAEDRSVVEGARAVIYQGKPDDRTPR
jgi:lipopolysaccharide export system protein LptA